MAKSADIYYVTDPWRVIERGFDPDRSRVSESIFSLANEFMGARGYFEEGTAAPSLLGSYFGGVYETSGEEGPGGYKGIVKQTHYMVCAADWLHTRLVADNEKLCIGESHIENFERVLDMRSGELTRSFVWILQNGKRVSVKFSRVLSMTDARQACQRVELSCDGECEVWLEMGINGGVVHQITGRCDWRKISGDSDGATAFLISETKTTRQQTRCAISVTHTDGIAKPIHEDWLVGTRIEASLTQPFRAERMVFNQVSEGASFEEDCFADYNTILASNRTHYDEFWRKSDVVIEGDLLNQQGIRFCLFQLHQTYLGLSGGHNIGAKGLTGEAYNGHAFWDTETYCLPYYLFTEPKAAKNLLMFRYNTLPQARLRAAQLDCAGACYPIATLNGTEACALWQHASLQMQPSTAVAYGIWNYVHQTGDDEFLRGPGLDMLIEISRYLVTRGDWNADRSGYGYYGVMGPDEFHMMVNNNYYTNLMGKKTLEYTLKVLASHPRADVSEEEKQTFRACAERMIMPNRKGLVFEQHEGYFSLPHIDAHAIPREEFPLYEHWSYDRLYRTDMIKQPDVLMAMFLYPGDYSKDELRANYEYYESRCIHESSLSPSVHSIHASALGLLDEARGFFGFATRLDLDNYNLNTGDGLHLTSIAAAWATIVFGFAGLRADGDMPSLAPTLPDGWTRYSLLLNLSGRFVRVTVDANGAAVTRESGEPLEILLNGEKITV